MSLKMAIWNCSGSLKLDVGAFEDSFKGRDIIFYSETQQAPGGILPKVSGYLWVTACRREVRLEYRRRGSGGVAILFKEELQPLISIVPEMIRQDTCGLKSKLKLGGHSRLQYAIFCQAPPITQPQKVNPPL